MPKKRSDGRYQQSFTFQGKRYVVYAKTKADLPQKVADKIEKLKSKEESHSNPTLIEYNKIYLDFKRNKIKESTMRNYSNWFQLISKIKLPSGLTVGKMHIKDIKPTDIAEIQRYLFDSGSSARTINGSLANLSRIFQLAIKDGTIVKNPCNILEYVKNTKPKASQTIHRALSKEETESFFKFAEESFYLNAFRLMLQTGLRIGELGALLKSDINLHDNILSVNKTITRDETGAYIVSSTPKTSTSTRDIPLNDKIKEIINDQKRISTAMFKTGRLFSSPEGCLIREYSLNREIKRICKKAGIEPFTNHAFRATFSTRFIEQRPQDYKALSEILGHSDTKITLDLYTHVMDETKEKAMGGLDIAM